MAGQLGTEDNVNRPLFREVGHKEIKVKPEDIKVPVRKYKRYNNSTWKYI